MVGVFLYDGAYTVLFEELLFSFSEMECDLSTVPLFLRLFDLIFTAAAADPQMRCFCARFFGQYFDFICHHKCGVKTDTELSDQGGIFFGVAAQFFYK